MHFGSAASRENVSNSPAFGTAPWPEGFIALPTFWGQGALWPQPWWYGALYQQAWQQAQAALATPRPLVVRAEDWPRASRN